MINKEGAEGMGRDVLLAILKSIEIIVDKSESKEEIKKALVDIQSQLKAR